MNTIPGLQVSISEADDPFCGVDAQGSGFAIPNRGKRFAPKECELQGIGPVAKPKPAKKANLNPIQQKWFRDNGYCFARVEVANPWGAVTVDLWGAFDYIAIHPDHPGVLFVQVTTRSGGNVSSRRKKIRAAPETAVLLAAGNRAEIHAWVQPGGAGTRWSVTVEEIKGE